MNVASNNDMKCLIALGALEGVYDPEINLNVVDLGLIYGIDFDEAQRLVTCTMTLTTQFCPMGESMVSNVRDTLANSFDGYKVDVMLTFEPQWNYERISEEGRRFLNH
jgi:metal-sulfur cluster biosynthetic enzyme